MSQKFVLKKNGQFLRMRTRQKLELYWAEGKVDKHTVKFPSHHLADLRRQEFREPNSIDIIPVVDGMKN